MDDEVPLTDMRSGMADQSTAYHPEHVHRSGYSKVDQQAPSYGAEAHAKDSSSRNPHDWSLLRKGLVFLVVLWCTFLGDFGSRISGSFKASVSA